MHMHMVCMPFNSAVNNVILFRGEEGDYGKNYTIKYACAHLHTHKHTTTNILLAASSTVPCYEYTKDGYAHTRLHGVREG